MRLIGFLKTDLDDEFPYTYIVLADGKPVGIRITMEMIADLKFGNAEFEFVVTKSFRENGLDNEESAELVRLMKVMEL